MSRKVARLIRGTGHEPAAHATAWWADASAPISACIGRTPCYLRAEMWADAAAEFMRAHGVIEAPVLDELGHPVGTVSVAELETGDALRPVEEDTEEMQLRDPRSRTWPASLRLSPGFH